MLKQKIARIGSEIAGEPAARSMGVLPALALWSALFALPLCFFFIVSFWSVRGLAMRPDLTLQNYWATLRDYGDVLASTLLIGLITAFVTTSIAWFFAFAIRFRAGRFGNALLFITLIALFGGYLVKIYAWKSILGRDGIINAALLALGLIDEPLTVFIYNANSVVITLTYFLLPFAVLPIYGSMRAIPEDFVEAARDLGAGSLRAAADIVLPLSEKGLSVAFLMAFLVSVGDYVTPRYVGGGASMMGHFIETQFSFGFNWPMGSAMSFTLMAVSLIIYLLLRTLFRRLVLP
ncbi:ABC transporter permease [Taklimakanibacter deserti]|uniref:ABC transporter permease n=1 Tax=Taklimakanibacter deserti TaxID=2267839 RepID=UPI000E6522B4